ncbi:hypothetical protein [Rubrimonas cliftonensis]|uniref:Uncharacterized protein n=1 Tax=Rubrimonas cliftonensis TaxID=89524 RepID=A0A1H3XAJ4_9RHOB|nr:hypothetical protein [Rubrimonas cliftonensis]SDZ96250.1 hypothetical protein SAMN05444370_102339 [Rubrimonas cliftonensis]
MRKTASGRPPGGVAVSGAEVAQEVGRLANAPTALGERPGVRETAEAGAPRRDGGESVVAILMAKRGAALDFKAVERAIRRDPASFGRPRRPERRSA